MRIARLDLLAYGHFTGRALEFPAAARDLHIVYGANEAGKSTALAALGDLLFGIPARSPYGFLHEYAKMRIGGVLEDPGDPLAFVRRKGNRDQIVDADGVPAPEAASRLGVMLGGAGRDDFERMFGLDHHRLRAGGEAMLEPGNDAGQALFAAGAGLEALHAVRAALQKEAEDLWAPRRAQHRAYYQADDRRKDAEKNRSELTLTTTAWRELDRNLRDAQRARDDADEELRDASAEAARVSRIRRVLPDVRRRQRLLEDLAALAAAPALPEDAAAAFDAARAELVQGQARIDTLSDQLERLRAELAEIAWDPRLLEEKDRIEGLAKRGIGLESGRADLPKRQAELQALEAELQRLGSELGWTEADPAALAGRIPARSAVQPAQALLRDLARIDTAVDTAAEALETAQSEHDRARRRLDAAGDAADATGLAAAIGAVRRESDIAGRLRAAERRHADAEAQVTDLLGRLHPPAGDEDAAAAAPAPTADRIREHDRRRKDLEEDRRDLGRQRAETEESAAGGRDEIERLRTEQPTVSAEELEDARAERDRLWKRIRARFVDGGAAADPGDGDAGLAGALEDAVRAADELADRRFRTAEASARLAAAIRELASREERLERLAEREAALEERHRELLSEWEGLWRDAPFEPLSPDEMTQWVATRDALAAALENRRGAAGERDVARRAEREARECLAGPMAALGAEIPEDVPLTALLERAENLKDELDERTRNRQDLARQVEQAEIDIGNRNRALERAREDRAAWLRDWSERLDALGLGADTPPDAAAAQIDLLDSMRELAAGIRDLREKRIAMIERDLDEFAEQASALVAGVAEDLVGRPAGDAVRELGRRLDAALRNAEAHAEKSSRAEAIGEQISELRTGLAGARAGLDALAEAAGTDDLEGLREAISESDRRRAVERDLREIEVRLARDGDGLAAEELERECADVEPDEAAAREAGARDRIREAGERKEEATVRLSDARRALEAAGGGDAAAQAEAARQESLAQMTEVAERYVRAGTSRLLLNWAIERYRRERQGPLLARAGELFEIVTTGAFTALAIEYGNDDKPALAGRRPAGESVPAGGMSDGTVDQLYLALRIAAVERYVERGNALPFLADDLFVNFDDDRAAAGFRALDGLAARTQVLFFTHHRHLVDIARETLDGQVSVVPCGAAAP